MVSPGRKTLLWLCLIGSMLVEVRAGGIELRLSGYRQMGMAHTGTGLAWDASAAFFNPGALSFIRRRHVQFGGSVLIPFATYLARTPNVNTADTDTSLLSPIYMYASWRKQGSRLTFGLSINNPFGQSVRWPSNWKGRFISIETSLNTFFIQPTVSYQLSDRWGIGAGVIYGVGNFLQNKALEFSGKNQTESSAEISGNGQGWGAQVGVYFRPSQLFSLGIKFRSSLDLFIPEGTAKFNVPTSLEQEFPETSFETTFTLPYEISMGLGYRPQENLLLALDVNFMGWGVFDSLTINYSDNTALLPDEQTFRNYRNTLSARVGAEFDIRQRWFFRAGAFFEGSPVPERFLSPEFPDANRIGTSLGIGFYIGNRMNIDIAYKYELTGERTESFDQRRFDGTYELSSHALGIGLNFSY